MKVEMKDEASPPLESNTSYAGRWVARVRGRIIAQGGTPEQALRASQGTRHKEKPEIVYMPTSFPLPALVQQVKQIVPPDERLYLVGGAVRDVFLGRAPLDLDFAVPSNGISAARKIANALHADFVRLDDERDTGRVIVTNENGTRIFLDFAAYRGSDLESDLRGRDFTINAIAYDLVADSIMDPLDGLQDLRAGVIRACSSSSFLDDPLRILRGVRQAAAFGFHIKKETRELMHEASAGLGRISVERLRDELFKILEGPEPHVCLRALEMLGTFPYFLPELSFLKGVEQSQPHVYDVWDHTLAVLESLGKMMVLLEQSLPPAEDMAVDMFASVMGKYRERFHEHFSRPLNTDRSLFALFFLAALYHDAGKPQTKTIDEDGMTHFHKHEDVGAEMIVQRGRGLNLSNDEINWLHTAVKNHMRIHSLAIRLQQDGKMPSRRAIYRFFRDSGEIGVDLVLLVLADTRGMRAGTLSREIWAGYLDICIQLLENYWDHPAEIVSPPRLLDGRDLMRELHLAPGPLVGQLLEAIRENQAVGKIGTREQALSFARNQLEKGITGRQ
jgi:putative nucleotidyltransferase with HDIG domain